jgi:tetratricopeptide (TPR) repeat protein
MVAKNPIEQRLDKVGKYWDEFFIAPQARLLRWLVNHDDRQMVELFNQLQTEEVGEAPDLFIRLETPFKDPLNYSIDLTRELQRQYEEVRSELATMDVPNQWIAPNPHPREPAIATFLQCCQSFQEYYRDLAANLALILVPTKVSSEQEWQNWLWSLLQCNPPSTVRFVVFDQLEHPTLEALCQKVQEKILTINPDLDVPGAMEEVANSSGDKNDPGTLFRQHFVAMSNAASKGHLERMTECANAAMHIAQQQNWPQMQFVIHMASGAAFLAANQIDQALSSYRQAHRIMEYSEDPTAPKLLIQSYLAEGSALLSKNAFPEAAAVYYQAGILAERTQEFFMALEGWRMAGYCYEVEKQPKQAWQCGHQALNAGEKLDQENRVHSTLPYAGQGLLRIAKQYGRPYSANEVHQRMETLIGPPAWKQALQEGGIKL